jgi:predicted PurR-regulated permease PerM
MHGPRAPFHFLILAIAGIATIAFFIFKPFIYALILAAVCAVIFQKPHAAIRRAVGGREGVAATISTVAILVIIVVPLAILGARVASEAVAVYGSLRSGSGPGTIFETVRDFAAQSLSIDIASYMENFLGWLAGNLGSVFSGAVRFVVDSVIFVIALFFALRDGYMLKRSFVILSPLADKDDEHIVRTLERAVNSVVVGRLATALVQGALAMVGFWAFGVPNAVLWGSVTTIAALIPGIGTALVVLPAIAYLYLNGMAFAAAGLGIWGVGFVGLVDNIIGPKLIGRGVPVHPFLILLSVLGGISFFGPMGFVMGPLALSLLFALLDTYRRDVGAC